jgi:hypothetical protein
MPASGISGRRHDRRGDWKSLKSLARYQDVDVEDQRAILGLIGKKNAR